MAFLIVVYADGGRRVVELPRCKRAEGVRRAAKRALKGSAMVVKGFVGHGPIALCRKVAEVGR